MLGALDLSKWHVDVLARSAPSQSISEVYWARCHVAAIGHRPRLSLSLEFTRFGAAPPQSISGVYQATSRCSAFDQVMEIPLGPASVDLCSLLLG